MRGLETPPGDRLPRRTCLPRAAVVHATPHARHRDVRQAGAVGRRVAVVARDARAARIGMRRFECPGRVAAAVVARTRMAGEAAAEVTDDAALTGVRDVDARAARLA